jgi:hypothetical protein
MVIENIMITMHNHKSTAIILITILCVYYELAVLVVLTSVRSILSILFYLNCKPFEIYQIHAHGNIE